MVTLNLRDDCNGRVATNFKRGMTDKRFLELEITAWLTSPERKKQLEGEAYYDGYQDVTHRERLALDEDGKPIVLKNLPNNRLVNNLYSKAAPSLISVPAALLVQSVRCCVRVYCVT